MTIFFLPETGGVEIHESVAPKQGEYLIQKHYSFQSQLGNEALGK
jgi:hypothetical protein